MASRNRCACFFGLYRHSYLRKQHWKALLGLDRAQHRLHQVPAPAHLAMVRTAGLILLTLLLWYVKGALVPFMVAAAIAGYMIREA